MKEIKGFIYYPVLGEQKGGALLAERFTMTRYHCRDTLAFAVRDSLNKAEALKRDSLKKVSDKEKADSLRNRPAAGNKDEVQRLTPEELNRRRTKAQREKKPEQIEVERHIQQERIEQRRERQMNQRRQQQQRRPESIICGWHETFCISLFVFTGSRVYQATGGRGNR